MSMSIADAFAHVLQGGPVELRALETEISVPLLMGTHPMGTHRMGTNPPMDAQTRADIEDLLVDAILRRSGHPIQMHLRLKKGFNATFAYDELKQLPTSAKDVARELARFYIRVADLRARILQEMQAQAQAKAEAKTESQPLPTAEARLQRAYATEIETMHNKQRENQAHLDRMLHAIIAHPDSDARCIHEAVTPEDLDALDLQLHDIVERGCAANELRCLKITEAATELQKYEALMTELQQCE
jgi:hypothetical protein